MHITQNSPFLPFLDLQYSGIIKYIQYFIVITPILSQNFPPPQAVK